MAAGSAGVSLSSAWLLCRVNTTAPALLGSDVKSIGGASGSCTAGVTMVLLVR